jgi:hypothetical protein
MHEHLKYSIKLNENFKAYVRPSARPNQMNSTEIREIESDWQSIYAGNDYGTHYLIYAKFIGKKLPKKGYQLNRVQIYLQNYSGNISIGLTEHVFFECLNRVDDDYEDPERDPRYPGRRRFQLTVGMQGFKSDSYFNSNVECLGESIVINSNDILYVEPFFLPIENDLTEIFNPCNRRNAKFIDEKFLERIGEDIIVSPIGKDRLRMLNEMGFIDDDKLELIEIDKRPNFERKGKEYPCTPRNSIFYEF